MRNKFIIVTFLVATIFNFIIPAQSAVGSKSGVGPEDDKTILSKDRITDLVIINDIYDISSLRNIADINFVLNRLDAAGTELQNALENDQLVLCTKFVWVYLQQWVFYGLLEKTAFEQFSKAPRDVLDYTRGLNYLKDLYNKIIVSFDETFLKINGIHNLVAFGEINAAADKLLGKLPDLNKKYINILFKKYICKKVGNDYLLFIPIEKQYRYQKYGLRDALLGLSYTNLPDYNYRFMIGEEEFLDIKNKSAALVANRSVLTGKMLLEALDILRIKDKNISRELLPFFNIYLMGHGTQDSIAELPIGLIQTEKGFDKSYFLKVLDFFNLALRTKTVSLLSCFIGGKKNIDAYKMSNNLESQSFLENLSYTILNIGTLNTSTYVGQKYKKYFEYLNQIPPNYAQVTDLSRFGIVDNYMSIKLPQTSWFTPVQLANKTVSLSQIDMATRQGPIKIDSDKLIILGANFIPQTIKIRVINNILPAFLPSNYHIQLYYFKSLELYGITESFDLFKVLTDMIFKNIKVAENIEFLFEKIKIENIVYKNVLCRISTKGIGFAYQSNETDALFYSWQTNDLPKSLPSPEEIVTKTKLDTLFKKEEDTILERLPVALRTEFLEDLSKKLEKGRMP